MDELFLEGAISVEAAILGGNRLIHALYIQQKKKRDRQIQRLQKTAVSHHIPVHKVDAAFIAERTDGKSHGGVIASVGERQFTTLEKLAEGKRPFLIMLDGIEDPFNFGQAIRAAYGAGCDGIVVRPRNWVTATAVVARASAGCSERIPMAIAETAQEAAGFFRQKEMIIACTAKEKATSIYKADLTQPIFLLIGGERRGITRSFLEMADVKLKIPYGRPFAHALGAATSTAIISFELMRQRQMVGK